MQTLRGVAALALVGMVACSSSTEPSLDGASEGVTQGASALVTEIATQPGRGQLGLPDTQLDVDVPELPRVPSRVLRYPGQYASFQAAIDAATDDAVIVVARGTHGVRATVRNKRVFVIGAGKEHTRLVGLDAQQNVAPPIFTLGAGAEVVLHNVSLATSGDAVVGAYDLQGDQGPRPSFAAKNVNIPRAMRAIYGTFGSVVVHSMTLESTLGDAIRLSGAPRVVFRKLTANGSDNGKTLLVDNTAASDKPCIVRIVDSVFRNGGRGGIAVLGGACPVYISRTRVEDASVFGIGLFDVPFARLLTVDILRTKAVRDPAGELFAGDGLFLWASHAEVDSTTVTSSGRAGVAVFGCAETGHPASLDISGSTLTCTSFDLVVEPRDLATGAACGAGSFALKDNVAADGSPSNLCFGCDGTPHPCKAQSAGLAPVPK